MGLKSYGIIAAALGIGIGVMKTDKAMNYVETKASIKNVEVECYVSNRKQRLVNTFDNKLVYMDCDEAKREAHKYKFHASDVHRQAKITYKWKSPADNKYYTDTHTTKKYKQKEHRRGQKIKILAHKTEPKKNYFD